MTPQNVSAAAPRGPVSTTPPAGIRTRPHLSRAVRFSPSEIRRATKEVEGFNAKLAVVITHAVGSMAMAYIFSLIALTKGDVPAFLTKPGLILIVAWVAQTFIQLVLLSIIMVGQDVQSIASDARSEHTFTDTQAILDALNTETKGGLKTILEAIEAQTKTLQQAAGPGKVAE
jgi:hypothetical protein